jgi:hypothetical protein
VEVIAVKGKKGRIWGGNSFWEMELLILVRIWRRSCGTGLLEKKLHFHSIWISLAARIQISTELY